MDTIQLRVICGYCGMIHEQRILTRHKDVLETTGVGYTFECYDCHYPVTVEYHLTKQSGERGEKNG